MVESPERNCKRCVYIILLYIYYIIILCPCYSMETHSPHILCVIIIIIMYVYAGTQHIKHTCIIMYVMHSFTRIYHVTHSLLLSSLCVMLEQKKNIFY